MDEIPSEIDFSHGERGRYARRYGEGVELPQRSVIITGDRLWTAWPPILSCLDSLDPDIIVVEGGARGADRIARRLAEALGRPHETIHAKWGQYGRSAGPIRNRTMLGLYRRSLEAVHAFHDNLDMSRGTLDMVRIALLADVPVELWDSQGHHGPLIV